ncbi:helicase ARIP4-like [Clytia hemisphaerica]|uniref:Helicase C-terminal domain-containing protein n=1 Tax=Clytia hemisphaerica TaxID=252671 RepID=A0A7M5XD47_9CNID
MSSQNLKRQAEECLEEVENQPKRNMTEHPYTVVPGPSNEYSIEDHWDEENESESELEEGEDHEKDEDSDMAHETVNIEDDSYLSFSDNEITEERISSKPTTTTTNVNTQKKLKKKHKKKNPNMRKNIRNVLTDTQLDSATQKLREQELDRLMRLGMIGNKSVVVPPMVNRSPVIVKPTTKPKQATKPSDVICLSSSDEDSHEPEGESIPSTSSATRADRKEIFVLSSDSDEEEMEDDGALANHHTDLGLHTRDTFNKPEADGRVWINLNKKEFEEKVFLSKHISQILKPHQIGGLRFMFDNLIESVNEFRPNRGNGCILAHAMGLGKTIQTITFINLFLKCTPADRVLCVVPVNTIQNWSHEFNKWIPKRPQSTKVETDILQNNVAKGTSPQRQQKSKGSSKNKTDLTVQPAQNENTNMEVHESMAILTGKSISPKMQNNQLAQFNLTSVDMQGPNGAVSSPQSVLGEFSSNNTSGCANNLNSIVTTGKGSQQTIDSDQIIDQESISQQSINSAVNSLPKETEHQSLSTDTNDLFSLLGCPSTENALAQNSEQSGFKTNLSNGQPKDTFTDFSTIKTLLDDMVNFVGENEKVAKQYDDSGMVVDPLNTGEDEDVDRYRDFDVYLIDAQKTWPDRINTIDSWVENGGVLLIGYEMYRMLASGIKFPKLKGRKGKILLEDKRDLKKAMKEAICDPGPDLVVCDEGHRIRNYQSGISQSLKSINTSKRLVLTGYPLQNNLIEYWCMVDFVRPDYLGTRQEFANMFERPILNGQCVDSTTADKRLMRERAHVLFSLLQGFVQRRGHKVFKSILPDKYEHVIMVRMSPAQKALYQRLVELTREAYSDSLNPIKTFHLCCKIWNHPDILYKAMQAASNGTAMDIFNDEDDIDNDTTTASSSSSTSGKPPSKRKKMHHSNSPSPAQLMMQAMGGQGQQPQLEIGFNPFGGPDPRQILMDITQWAPEVFQNCGYKPGDVNNSGKFLILSQLIREAVAEDDKMLIFSQSLFTLNTIEEMLKKSAVVESEPSGSTWKKGEHYFRIDGSTTSYERERYINAFNEETNRKAKLFLLSTRAGCLGINLVGANRVVVFDVSWNPCHDAQAVCRVYRYGQVKPCYIYRLVASNTMEKKIYYRQISKQGISNRVVDEMNQTENFSKNEIQSLIAEDWVEEPRPDFSHFVTSHCDRILSSIVLECSDWITQVPFKHESLLINDEETDKLTGSEKRAAKRAYEQQKQISRGSYGGGGFGYRPLQPNFPLNPPVAPVRPFSWRPPISITSSLPSMASNSGMRISFPVMIGNQTITASRTVHSSNNTTSSSMNRVSSFSPYQPRSLPQTTSITSSTADPLLNSMLTSLRGSLSASHLIRQRLNQNTADNNDDGDNDDDNDITTAAQNAVLSNYQENVAKILMNASSASLNSSPMMMSSSSNDVIVLDDSDDEDDVT